jgi:tetratricopeptide (TPR) repeat protein
LERAVTEQTSHLFTLMGPAGVGKSRLVHEFLNGEAAGATVLRGRCLSYGEGITLYPLAEVIHRAAAILDTDPPAVARSKLDAVLVGAPDAERVAGLVGGLFGWAEPGATEDAFWAVRKLLEHLARERPVVLEFDDIHWAEPTFLDLIDHLADWTREAAVLILCVARPELLEVRSGWGGGKMNATSILLEPLPADEASRLVDNLLGRADIPQVARDRILEAAEGNPLFVEEMLAMLIDDGLLRFEHGAWHSVEDLADVTIPPTIHLLLAARLDRLDSDERGVMERGAVEGKVFHSGAVTTLSPPPARPHVRSRLLALARKELIRPDRAEFAGEDAFRFRHLLIRDAAYHAMPKEQRADLHERFAGWLAEAASERMAEYEEILAHHLEQAYRYRVELGAVDEPARELAQRAGRHLAASALRAAEREDMNAAAAFFERSIDLLEGTELLRAMVRHAELREEMGDFRGAVEGATRAMDLADALGDRPEALRAKLVHIMSIGQVDPARTLSEATTAVEEILAEATDVDDRGLADQARLALARISFFLGKTSRTLEILEPLMGHASRWPRRDRRQLASEIGTSAYFGATPVDEALVAVERARQIEKTRLSAEVFALRVSGGLLAMAGRFEEANAAFDRCHQLVHELGDPVRSKISTQIDGEALRLEGRTEDAERLFRSMIEILDAMGETGFNSTICALLAHTLCDQRRFDEAEPFVGRCREMAAEDDFASQASWRMAQARVLADRGQVEEALRLADEAVAINEETDYLSWQGDGLEVKGMVLETAGRDDDAQAAYGDSLDRFERKGNVVAADRVRARMRP